MKVARDKLVQFTYYITDDTGETVERIDLPMSCVFMRHNRLYDPVEAAMLGASANEEVSATLLPTDTAWGEFDPSLTFTDSVDNAPPEFRRIGAEVPFENANGESRTFRVSKIDAKTITLDANHPFAGKVMKFFVKILSVRDATGQELVEGVDTGTSEIPLQSSTMH
jgi:FKBP-type peptidyl-prolyl cis-trans isomerase SlyD